MNDPLVEDSAQVAEHIRQTSDATLAEVETAIRSAAKLCNTTAAAHVVLDLVWLVMCELERRGAPDTVAPRDPVPPSTTVSSLGVFAGTIHAAEDTSLRRAAGLARTAAAAEPGEVERLLLLAACVYAEEADRRAETLGRLEADLQGGHFGTVKLTAGGPMAGCWGCEWLVGADTPEEAAAALEEHYREARRG